MSDVAKLLKQPEKLTAKSRSEELSGWRSWFWELERYLGAIRSSFVAELATVRTQTSAMSLNDLTKLQLGVADSTRF